MPANGNGVVLDLVEPVKRASNLCVVEPYWLRLNTGRRCSERCL